MICFAFGLEEGFVLTRLLGMLHTDFPETLTSGGLGSSGEEGLSSMAALLLYVK